MSNRPTEIFEYGFINPRLKPLPPIEVELQSRALVNSVGSELRAALGAYKKE